MDSSSSVAKRTGIRWQRSTNPSCWCLEKILEILWGCSGWCLFDIFHILLLLHYYLHMIIFTGGADRWLTCPTYSDAPSSSHHRPDLLSWQQRGRGWSALCSAGCLLLWWHCPQPMGHLLHRKQEERNSLTKPLPVDTFPFCSFSSSLLRPPTLWPGDWPSSAIIEGVLVI